jgi:hypothetical protein
MTFVTMADAALTPGSYEIFMVRVLRFCKGRLLKPMAVVPVVSDFIALSLFNWKT